MLDNLLKKSDNMAWWNRDDVVVGKLPASLTAMCNVQCAFILNRVFVGAKAISRGNRPAYLQCFLSRECKVVVEPLTLPSLAVIRIFDQL